MNLFVTFDRGVHRLVEVPPGGLATGLPSVAISVPWYGARGEPLDSTEKAEFADKVERLVVAAIGAALAANPADPLLAAETLLKSVGDADQILRSAGL